MKPAPQHAWLKKLVGDWAYETEGNMNGETFKFAGKESVRAVGDFWVIGEGTCEMPGGGTGTTMLSVGYDPQKGKYVGTWLGSMMPNLWVYEGDLSGDKLDLHADGPDCMGDGSIKHFIESTELKADGTRVFTSSMRQPDGSYKLLMTTTYRREN